MILKDHKMLLKPAPEAGAGHLIGLVECDPVEVLVGLELQDGVDKTERLVADVVPLTLGDDFQNRTSVELLTVGGDV